MSSSMVLQSRLEPPRGAAASGLKMVTTTKSHFLKPSLPVSDSDTEALGINEKHINPNADADSGGWSFIQALTNNSQTKQEDQSYKPYVHPHYTRSPTHLSNKSLELCTETLGSETGSDNGLDIDIFSSSSSDSESNKSPTKQKSRLLRNKRNGFGSKKVNNGSLPPPLTSISGSNCYSIKPRREGGRLVMKAVLVPSSNSCFQAERRDGRLKLHYVKNSEYSPYSSDSDQEPQEVENKGNGGDSEVKIQRPSRCKEGGMVGSKGLLVCEAFWVTT